MSPRGRGAICEASEREAIQAIRALSEALDELAEAVLDRPFADPDDDCARLARAAKRVASGRALSPEPEL